MTSTPSASAVSFMTHTRRVAIVVAGLLAAVGCSAGCSPPAPATEDCLGATSSALKTCAKGATVGGIDVSYYQGTVNWAQVKASGRAFAFARVSDGLNYPDTKFAQNWPAMKSAGLVRGAYQFFRPSQDPASQAQLLIDKLEANGGLKPGDLPPVLDLESADGLASSAVVARAKTWLAKVEAKYGVKPLVYTAAFMSNVIGTSFSAYPLWVANYQTTCPTMPSGWTDWKFWQSSDSGSVSGVGGNVDTNFFNGPLTALLAFTLQPAAPGGGAAGATGSDGIGLALDDVDVDVAAVDDALPNDGSQGSTLGSGSPPSTETSSAPITPCR